MATVHFWGKPGCQTNIRQQAILRAAGHELILHDLLHEAWSPQRLLDFFIDLPVEAWFNMNAPKVKSGEISPDLFDTSSALKAMIAEPILIRRPLIEIGTVRLAGFDAARLETLIGLNGKTVPDTCSASVAGHGGQAK
ncbi:MAG: hypothetical protein H6R19_633 [Proteobacteria bacterium]|nr:hypothetical protein [Pseudomonadota bacterium]